MMESALDDRNRIRNAKISRNYGTALVRDLRELYGENFAAGHADTVTLREVINRLDAASLNRLHTDLEKGQAGGVPAGLFKVISPLTPHCPDEST
jgi:alpha-amylase/alpha-mannosidase (GH57 family)